MKIGLTELQKKAIESIDQSMLVVAGAGSGKTTVLVQRYVEILQKQPNLSVQNLLAVTYTRKAAKEMRTRIKSCLKDLYEQSQKDGTDEQLRWHQCLADMDSAYIDTIHSLCQSILNSFAIEIGLEPDIEVLDEIDRAQLVQDSIDETIRQIISLQQEGNFLLEHFSLDTIEEFLQLALKNHLRFDELAKSLEILDEDALSNEIENLLYRMQKQLLYDLTLDEEWQQSGSYLTSSLIENNKLAEIRQTVLDLFTSINNIARTNGSAAEKQMDQVREGWKLLLEMASLGAVRVGGNTETAKEMRASIRTIVGKGREFAQADDNSPGLPLSFLSEDNEKRQHYWRLWRDLIAVARKALSIYQTNKQELGKFDFDDLIAKTKAVLKEENSVIRHFYNKILAHIMVDEFQDTNAIQSEVITLLCGPQTRLFLIGDDKQSIYKFQGADVSTFNTWQRKEISSLVFEHSFRSQHNIVKFVNGLFSNLLSAQAAHVDYRAKYSPLKAERNALLLNDTDCHPAVEVLFVPEQAEPEKDQDKQLQSSGKYLEGRAVANWIFDKVHDKAIIVTADGAKRTIEYGDFAVLTSTNGDLQIFESCLSELAIPYVTSGGQTFLERQEVYDLENMLSFLSNPSDSHSLVAVLRSPMFAFTDAIIHDLVSHDLTNKNEPLWQRLQEYREASSLPVSASVTEAIFVLKRLIADMPFLRLSELVFRIIRDTNYDLLMLSLPDGKQRYKNIWKFYFLAKDEYSPYEFTQRLQLSRSLSVSETNATIDSKQAVKLMTIHAAKGLEFPAVALPCLSGRFSPNKDKLLFHQQYGIVLNTTRTEEERQNDMPLPYRLGKVFDEDMEIAEKRRLLYVALTRARDYLSVFVKESGVGSGSPASWLTPILDRIDASSFSQKNVELQDLLKKRESFRPNTKDNEIYYDPSLQTKIEQLLEHRIDHSTSVDLPELEPLLPVTPLSNGQKLSPIVVGNFFHRLMEYLPQSKSSLQESEIAALVEQYSGLVHDFFKKALIKESMLLLSTYEKSNLLALVKGAKTICHEWNYYLKADSSVLSLQRPDLILEAAEGTYYLIDYKTDRFDISELEQQALRHRPQLERYGKHLEQLTGINAKLGVYFAYVGSIYFFN